MWSESWTLEDSRTTSVALASSGEFGFFNARINVVCAKPQRSPPMKAINTRAAVAITYIGAMPPPQRSVLGGLG